jgi:hypothetical protein
MIPAKPMEKVEILHAERLYQDFLGKRYFNIDIEFNQDKAKRIDSRMYCMSL